MVCFDSMAKAIFSKPGKRFHIAAKSARETTVQGANFQVNSDLHYGFPNISFFSHRILEIIYQVGTRKSEKVPALTRGSQKVHFY